MSELSANHVGTRVPDEENAFLISDAIREGGLMGNWSPRPSRPCDSNVCFSEIIAATLTVRFWPFSDRQAMGCSRLDNQGVCGRSHREIGLLASALTTSPDQDQGCK